MPLGALVVVVCAVPGPGPWPRAGGAGRWVEVKGTAMCCVRPRPGRGPCYIDVSCMEYTDMRICIYTYIYYIIFHHILCLNCEVFGEQLLEGSLRVAAYDKLQVED